MNGILAESNPARWSVGLGIGLSFGLWGLSGLYGVASVHVAEVIFALGTNFVAHAWALGFYLLAAWALGCGLSKLLRRDDGGWPVVVTLTLGIAALIHAGWIAAWLLPGVWIVTRWLAIGLAVVGGALAVQDVLRWWVQRDDTSQSKSAGMGHWPSLLLAIGWGVAIAGLLLAAMKPPGAPVLFEYGGYDALSYHLQIPKEYLAQGRMVELPHNTYSYLPGFVELAYTQLGALHGHMIDAAITAQLLHATMAILAAMFILHLVNMLTGGERRWAGHLAALIYLTLPWTIITAGLAYNEQAMILFTTLAMWAAMRWRVHGDLRSWVMALLIAIGAGMAMGAKLSAGPMLILPIFAWLAWFMVRGATPRADLRRTWGWLIVAGLGASALLLPYFARNAIWTGNPVFPQATGLLGYGHWEHWQAAMWQAAHHPNRPWGENLGRFVEQVLLHLGYGLVLWPVVILWGGLLLLRDKLRSWVLSLLSLWVLMAVIWMNVGHQQSRFAIGMLLPAMMILGLACTLRPLWQRILSVLTVSLLLAILCIGNFVINSHDAIRPTLHATSGQPGGATRAPYNLGVYHSIHQLPDDARIYAEGFATPFYVARPIDYRTVWEASPLAAQLHTAGPEAAGQWLIDQGYTHLIVDWTMLQLWTSPGNYGYDPRLNLEQLHQLTRLLPQVKHEHGRFFTDAALYALPTNIDRP